MSGLCTRISEAVIGGSVEAAKKLTQQALGEGVPAQTILDQGLVPGMDVVGQRFRAAEIFVPEVLFAAKAVHAAMEILKPLLADSGASRAGKVVVGTVEGDIHNIGKNLVAIMLQGAGFEVVDLGADVKVRAFVEAVKEHRPDIVGMSALLTTTMPKMEETIKALRAAGIRDQLKVLVGGAPVSQRFAEEIGADGYASNATSAVEVAKLALRGRVQ